MQGRVVHFCDGIMFFFGVPFIQKSMVINMSLDIHHKLNILRFTNGNHAKFVHL